MKKLLLILTVAALAPQCLLGQVGSLIKELPELHSDKSLIADCPAEDVTVIYDRHEQGTSYFYLCGHDNSESRIALSNNYTVEDMKCLGSHLYFGGRNISTQRGYLCCLNVSEWLNNGQSLYIFCDMVDETYYDMSFSPTRVFSLATFWHESGVRVAFLTDVVEEGFIAGNTVGDAYFDGSIWHLNYYFNKGLFQRYNDIDATDHYVVAVGYDTDDTSRYTVSAWCQSTCFLNTPTAAPRLRINEAVGCAHNALITRLAGDGFVVAFPYLHGDLNFIRDDHYKFSSSSIIPLNGYSLAQADLASASNLSGLSYAGSDTVVHIYSKFISWFIGVHPIGGSWIRKVARGNYHYYTSVCHAEDNAFKLTMMENPNILQYGYKNLSSLDDPCFDDTYLPMARYGMETSKWPYQGGIINSMVKETHLLALPSETRFREVCNTAY